MKRLSTRDKEDICYQLQGILRPSQVVDVAFDAQRMIVYAAVEYRNGGSYLPDGHIYGLAAQIYKADDGEKGFWNYNYVVTSDEMPAESCGIGVHGKILPLPRSYPQETFTAKKRMGAGVARQMPPKR